MSPTRLTPNQIVAWNLARARALRGWTQQEAAERLEPYIGERWSKATYSAAERSVDGQRIRQFTADDIFAFSRAFDLPMTLFLTPPPWSGEEIGHAAGGATSTRAEYLDSIFDMPEAARKRLLEDVVELSAPTTRVLQRWSSNFAVIVDDRKRAVEHAGFEMPKEEDR